MCADCACVQVSNCTADTPFNAHVDGRRALARTTGLNEWTPQNKKSGVWEGLNYNIEASEINRAPFTVHHSPFTVHRSPFTVHQSVSCVNRSPFTVVRVCIAFAMHTPVGVRERERRLCVRTVTHPQHACMPITHILSTQNCSLI